MPLPSSKNIGLKLSGKGTSSVVEGLKLQHAEELHKAHEEHTKAVEALEEELEECREEIETLKAISEEHTDTLTPLPSPSKSLKFVKNTTNRKNKKWQGRDVATVAADLKKKHKKDLARAAEVYAKKLKALKLEVERYKKETEALKTSRSKEKKTERGSAGVNQKTGVADTDKENATRSKKQSSKAKTLKGDVAKKSSGDKKCLGELDGNMRAQYERLIREDYRLETDPACEEALSSADNALQQVASDAKELDALCEDLTDFMQDVRMKSCLSAC
ncbi:hypothetical protein ACHAXT_007410 [Thalassiosira profunda]